MTCLIILSINTLQMKRIITFCALSILVFSCKKEQSVMNPLNQGCDCAKEVSADFLMEEMATPIGWPYEPQLTDSDTVYANTNIHFYAKEAGAEYTWVIGSEEVHEREFYRYFSSALIGETLEMKLIVNKSPNLICLPNDDGKDTLIRYLTVVEEPLDFFSTPNPRFEGVFRLKDANMTDSVDVTVEILGTVDVVSDRIRITNYDGQGTEKDLSVDAINYRQVWFTAACYNKIGSLFHDLNNQVRLELRPNELNICPYHLLKGRKL